MSSAADLFNAAATNAAQGLSLSVDGVELRHWTKCSLHCALDDVSTFQFEAPFEASNPLHRAAFVPGMRKPAVVAYDGAPIITGFTLDAVSSLTEEGSIVAVSGISLAGLLQGSCIPPLAWQPSFAGVDFGSICRLVGGALLVPVVYEGPSFKPRDPKCEISTTAWDFLAGLAKQRGLLLSANAAGALLVRDCAPLARTALPVAALAQGEQPLLEVLQEHASQDWHSDILVVSKASSGRSPGGKSAGAKGASSNRFYGPLFRSYLTTKAEDSDDADVSKASAAKLARMIGAFVVYRVKLPTWLTPLGTIWEPGQLVTLEAPSAQVYSPTSLMVRGVTLSLSESEATAELELVLPSTYTGEAPSRLPWQGGLP